MTANLDTASYLTPPGFDPMGIWHLQVGQSGIFQAARGGYPTLLMLVKNVERAGGRRAGGKRFAVEPHGEHGGRVTRLADRRSLTDAIKAIPEGDNAWFSEDEFAVATVRPTVSTLKRQTGHRLASTLEPGGVRVHHLTIEQQEAIDNARLAKRAGMFDALQPGDTMTIAAPADIRALRIRAAHTMTRLGRQFHVQPTDDGGAIVQCGATPAGGAIAALRDLPIEAMQKGDVQAVPFAAVGSLRALQHVFHDRSPYRFEFGRAPDGHWWAMRVS